MLGIRSLNGQGAQNARTREAAAKLKRDAVPFLTGGLKMFPMLLGHERPLTWPQYVWHTWSLVGLLNLMAYDPVCSH